MSPADSLDAITDAVFGFRLRASQRRAVESIVAGHDTLAVLPTGSGKSAIYQTAGLALNGLTIVVSPLIALQRDQLRSLTARRLPDGRPVRAAMINSSQHTKEHEAALRELDGGELDFVLLGPEQLANATTHGVLVASPRPVALVTIDEAHLISDWGHDFRPEYLRLPDTISAIGGPPVLALTATASPPVQADITRQLHMRSPHVLVADFDRPNISLAVRRTRTHLPEARAVDDRTVETVLDTQTPALVYALSRARCHEIAERLQHDAFTAAPYHAGLAAGERAAVQDKFYSGHLDVVVATSAFGMGIDKPDVRAVIHAGVPGSLDEYYQEIGRAGRDGQPAAAVLVYDPRTIRIPRLLAARSRIPDASTHAFVDALDSCGQTTTLEALALASGLTKHVTQRLVDELAQIGLLTLDADAGTLTRKALPPDTTARLDSAGARHQAILASRIEAARLYAESTHCRRAELLAYFGEHYEPPCGACDNDSVPPSPRPRVHSTPPTAGTPVHHRLWGAGSMLSRDEHELVVVFDTVGYRHLTPRSLHDGILTLD